MILLSSCSINWNDKNTLVNQEKCSNDAKDFFNQWSIDTKKAVLWSPEDSLITNFENHYSSNLSACFMHITGHLKSKSDTNKFASIILGFLYNVEENKKIGHLSFSDDTNAMNLCEI
jgi:hypothetical protein